MNTGHLEAASGAGLTRRGPDCALQSDLRVLFTIDYEIYGNGQGSLAELVYEPGEKLRALFNKKNAKLVVFVEASELEMIRAAGTDEAIALVEQQIRDFRREGHEIALHLHPQWYNARHSGGEWHLDYSEYNLCTLAPDRIEQILARSIRYLRTVLNEPAFTPVSFRAGNWLFQPTQNAARALASAGIRIDSSVFKGGIQHKHKLDYRPSLKNPDYWFFGSDVNVPQPGGPMLEFPIYTRMVPPWKMVTKKRVGLQKKGVSRKGTSTKPSPPQRLVRFLDYLRLRHPLKFDFCRMTFEELVAMTNTARSEAAQNSGKLKPMVSIGHTKDLTDLRTVEAYLDYLHQQSISICTLEDLSRRVQRISS